MKLKSIRNITAYNGPAFHGFRVQRIVKGHTFRLYVSATAMKPTKAAQEAKDNLDALNRILGNRRSWTRAELTDTAGRKLETLGFTVVAPEISL